MDYTYDEENRYDRQPHQTDHEPPRQEAMQKTVEESIYAGFWIRLWAYLLDLLIVGAVNGIFITPIFMFMDSNPTLLSVFTIQGLLTAIMAYVYFAIMTRYLGQTLGKMVFGLRVVRADGGKLSWSDVFFREVVGRMIHRVLRITNLMYIVVGVHPEKAGVHDLFADTRVIRDTKIPADKEDEDDDE